MTEPSNSHARRTFLTWLALFAVGLLAFIAGSAFDLSWLRIVGIVLLFPVAVAVSVLLLFAAFFVFVYYGLHLLALLGTRRARAGRYDENGGGRAEELAGPGVSTEQCYHLIASRQKRVTDPDELRAPVTRLVRALQRIGGRDFALYAYSPARHKYRVMTFWRNLVPNFLATSEIQWGFGRDASDPTHQVTFFTRFPGMCSVYLRIEFVLTNDDATGPGLRAKLRLSPCAAGRDEAHRAARLERLRQILVETLRADECRLELPTQPDPDESQASAAG